MCMSNFNRHKNLFCCPKCFSNLIFVKTDDEFVKTTDDLYCTMCDTRYPIFGSIPFFIDINKSGWVSLNLAKKLWETTGKAINFNEFV